MKYSCFGDNIKHILGWEYDEINPNFVFSFGGDGTMLSAIRKYQYELDKVIFVGVKKGNLGFFYGFEDQEFDSIVSNIKNQEYQINQYKLLHYKLNNNIIGKALNEIALTNPINTQIIDVYLNEVFFERFRGTGLIISTPAGSTAYNKSVGGGIIDPLLDAFQLVEIASINNRIYKSIASPLILSSKTSLKLKFITNENLFMCVDGIEVHNDITEIEITLSDEVVNILSKKEDFFTKVSKAFL